MQLRCFETKLSNLMLKTLLKQLLGFLPLDIVLPGLNITWPSMQSWKIHLSNGVLEFWGKFIEKEKKAATGFNYRVTIYTSQRNLFKTVWHYFMKPKTYEQF